MTEQAERDISSRFRDDTPREDRKSFTRSWSDMKRTIETTPFGPRLSRGQSSIESSRRIINRRVPVTSRDPREE